VFRQMHRELRLMPEAARAEYLQHMMKMRPGLPFGRRHAGGEFRRGMDRTCAEVRACRNHMKASCRGRTAARSPRNQEIDRRMNTKEKLDEVQNTCSIDYTGRRRRVRTCAAWSRDSRAGSQDAAAMDTAAGMMPGPAMPDMTPEQQEKIDACAWRRSSRWRPCVRPERQGNRTRRALAAEEPDANKIIAKVKEIGDIKEKMELARINHQLKSASS